MIRIQNATFSTKQELMDEMRHYLCQRANRPYYRNVYVINDLPFMKSLLEYSNVNVAEYKLIEISMHRRISKRNYVVCLIDHQNKKHKISWIDLIRNLDHE